MRVFGEYTPSVKLVEKVVFLNEREIVIFVALFSLTLKGFSVTV